jgi:hypothetical protein
MYVCMCVCVCVCEWPDRDVYVKVYIYVLLYNNGNIILYHRRSYLYIVYYYNYCLHVVSVSTYIVHPYRESVLFIGTQFSNLYTEYCSVYSIS